MSIFCEYVNEEERISRAVEGFLIVIRWSDKTDL
jgi:hypothetical protein